MAGIYWGIRRGVGSDSHGLTRGVDSDLLGIKRRVGRCLLGLRERAVVVGLVFCKFVTAFKKLLIVGVLPI